jgi:adenylate cyclase
VAERLRRRNSLLRIGLPLAGVGLITGFLLGITVYADRANRSGVLGLTNTLLRSTQERISLQVSAYLDPAAHTTLLAHAMLGRGSATTQAEEAYSFARSELNATPQIANVLFADTAGNFMLVTRASNGPPGATETKRILMTSTGRTVEWFTRDGTGNVTAHREDPKDDYDARTRSWFIGARKAKDVFWSGVYVFFSERAPGITAAVHGPGDNPEVIGVDIRLDKVSRFLSTLSIGRSGRAFIVAKDGTMIAGPDSTRILQDHEGKLVPARIDGMGDADLVAAWDHYRTEGAGNRIIKVNDRRLISIVTPLAQSGQDWLIFISAPESEFSGFVTANSRHVALLLLIVVALAAGLAMLLVRQGFRADKAARVVAERSATIQRQSAAFARLTNEVGIVDDTGSPPKALTETLADATGAKRVGVWRLAGQGQILRCDDSFEPATGGHVDGLELSSQEVPALFEALAKNEPIDAPDAGRDRRTAAFHGSLMAPLGTTKLYAVPIGQAGHPLGLVILEDARSDRDARDFVQACAMLVGVTIRAKTSVGTGSTEPTHIQLSSAREPAVDDQGLDPALAAAPPDDATQAHAAVLVLNLSEAAVPFAHQIACAAQEVAAAHALPYVKMLGTRLVIAAGFVDRTAGGVREACLVLADAAIVLRERCAGLCDGDHGLTTFGLGLDVGPILGARLGDAPSPFNLWGEAVRCADALASSAPAEAIQASEQAYLLLRQGFLFRPRGLFFRPGTGETRSYVLAGRA